MQLTNRRPRDSGAALLLALAATFTNLGYAGEGAWTSAGPYGGSVSAVAFDPVSPGTLYAAAGSRGVFKSTDSGDTWADVGLGSAHSLALDPKTPSTLYAGGDGVFRSTDAGTTWTLSPTRPIGTHALAIDPVTPSTLYAGTEGNGIFKSTDSGDTFAKVNVGLPNTYAGQVINALVVDPKTPSVLYAGVYVGGVFKSTDSGGTWAAVNTGLTGFAQTIRTLAIDLSTPATLYAGTDSGIFKSTDGGGAWASLRAGQTTALAIDPGSRNRLYAAEPAGVFKSTDAGSTWVASGTDLPKRTVLTLAVHPAAASTIYAGISDSRGLFRSTDSGGAWAAANSGLASLDIHSLVLDPVSPATLYAGTVDAGARKSTDSGGTWSVLETTDVTVLALAVSRSDPATLYAGGRGGVSRSTDAGRTWADPANKGLTIGLVYYGRITALALDPTIPSTIYAVGDHELGDDRVFRSTDSGGTWADTALSTGYEAVWSLAIDPVNHATLYAGTNHGLFKSTDSGGTWKASGPADVYSLVFDPVRTDTIYAGAESGVFKSTDSGATWIASSTGLTSSISALAIDPGNPSVLYAGKHRGGVFKSVDSGVTWAPASLGLPTSSRVWALALDASGSKATLHAGLESRGVWQSTPPTGDSTLLLPSSARVWGVGGTFYSTDLTVSNTGSTPTTFVLKFLGHDVDGRSGPETSHALAAGESITFSDVLGSVFDLQSGFGAIRITSPSDSLRVLSQTSTPGFGGTFGQSVPAAREEDLITGSNLTREARSIVAVREDASFRTNLILANATANPLEVEVLILGEAGYVNGRPLASKVFTLPPLGMTQVFRVARALGLTTDVPGARLVLSALSSGGRFAAYASVIDNVTNDPRTLLPTGPVLTAKPSPNYWLLPAVARTSGMGGAFYTTDLSVFTSDRGPYTLEFLGNNADGRGGPEVTFELGDGDFVTYRDVLSSVFQRASDFGAIRLAVPVSSRVTFGVVAQTSTPGFGGTFGQSVPGAASADLIRVGARSILAVREDDDFRTNLVLANATEADLDVDVKLVSARGETLAGKRYPLPPLGMTQVTRVVRDLGIAAALRGARLELSTPTPGGAFAAHASAIDNVTNDPRTLLPR